MAYFVVSVGPLLLIAGSLIWDVALPLKSKRQQIQLIEATATPGRKWQEVRSELAAQGYTFVQATPPTLDTRLVPLYRLVEIPRRSYTIDAWHYFAAWTQDQGYAIPYIREPNSVTLIAAFTTGTVVDVLRE